MLPSKLTSKQSLMSFMSLLIVGAMIFVACAPEDLDYIPTETPIVPIMTPTPLPEGQIDPRQEQINILRDVLPQSFESTTSFDNIVIWRVDRAEAIRRESSPPGLINGIGLRTYYEDETNSKAELTFVVFSTPEDATRYYDRIRSVRESAMTPAEPLDSLPMPNLVGGGSNRGSIALIQLNDVYFIEVFVPVFDSVRGDPRNGTAQQAVEFWEEAILRFNTPRFKDEQIASIRTFIPDQITTDDEVWEFNTTVDIDDIKFGTGFLVRYRGQTVRRDVINISVLAFDLPQDALDHYVAQQRTARGGNVTLSLQQGQPMEGIDATNTSIIGSTSNGAAIFQVGDVYYVEVNAERTTSILDQETFDVASNITLDFVSQGIAAFNGASPTFDDDTADSIEPSTTPTPSTSDATSDDEESVADTPTPEADEGTDTQIIG